MLKTRNDPPRRAESTDRDISSSDNATCEAIATFLQPSAVSRSAVSGVTAKLATARRAIIRTKGLSSAQTPGRVAKHFIDSSAKTERLPERYRSGFRSTYRPPDKWRRQQRQKAREPVIGKGQVVNQREIKFAMQLSGKQINTDLPEVVIESNSRLPSLPEPGPARQIEIDKMNTRHRVGCQRLFDCGAIIHTGNDPAFFEAPDLAHPVPSAAGLGTLAGFARVCGDKDSHIAFRFLCFNWHKIRYHASVVISCGAKQRRISFSR